MLPDVLDGLVDVKVTLHPDCSDTVVLHLAETTDSSPEGSIFLVRGTFTSERLQLRLGLARVFCIPAYGQP